jgi:hypothetical protein
VSLWHIPSTKPVGRPINIGGRAGFLSARPDGSGYVCGGRDRIAVEWGHLGPKTGSLEELKTWVEGLTGLTRDPDDELTPISPRRQAR